MLYPKQVQCPKCKVKRLLDYREVWEIKNHKRTSKCFKCSRFKKGEINSGCFKKGIVPWNVGKKLPKLSGINNPSWKGENAKYCSKHQAIYRKYGKANKCENKNCIYPRINSRGDMLKKPKKYHWANISKKYKRDRNDWIMLCVSCHIKWDRDLIDINY